MILDRQQRFLQRELASALKLSALLDEAESRVADKSVSQSSVEGIFSTDDLYNTIELTDLTYELISRLSVAPKNRVNISS
jgi:hypothetical protein